VQKLSDLMVEAGRTERIQKIIDTFGIDEAARDRVYFRKVLDEEGPVWIAQSTVALKGLPRVLLT
jgi:hypothetical protein